MKALTVWQPWATLIAVGAKPYEFRGWKPPASLIGQRIAIHAGARPMRPGELRDLLHAMSDPMPPAATPCLRKHLARPLIERILETHSRGIPSALPLSHIVATAIVGDPKAGDQCVLEFGQAAGNDSDREGTFNWGWPMLEVHELQPPEPARGAQGLWNWSGA